MTVYLERQARHKCLATLDTELCATNTELVRNLLNPNHVFIATTIKMKKRGARPTQVLASYCPVCGKKLPA